MLCRCGPGVDRISGDLPEYHLSYTNVASNGKNYKIVNTIFSQKILELNFPSITRIDNFQIYKKHAYKLSWCIKFFVKHNIYFMYIKGKFIMHNNLDWRAYFSSRVRSRQCNPKIRGGFIM